MFQWFFEVCHVFRAIPRAISFFSGSPVLAVRQAFFVLRHEGFQGIVQRATILLGGSVARWRSRQSSKGLYEFPSEKRSSFNPKISVIIPNYNHEKYLRERLESVYGQTYKNIEVILLDDRSTDGSVTILQEFAGRFPDRTICSFNDVNSGGVFRQWAAGLEHASGEIIWIAESDDYCSLNFLEAQIGAFQNSAVMLSFCNTDFVTEDQHASSWSLRNYLADLDLTDWDCPFIRSGHSLVNSGWASKNIVPNVSGVLFRRPHRSCLLHDEKWLNLRLCGDWIFYLHIIRGGLVAYSPNATNFYRQHIQSTSRNMQREDVYYAEHKIVTSYLVQLFRVDRRWLDTQERLLYDHWRTYRAKFSRDDFRIVYDLDRLMGESVPRRPNIIMAVYALTAGGGETFPIILANVLHERGYAVTILNFQRQPTEIGVLQMLNPDIPRLDLVAYENVGEIIADIGGEIVHSHHAWVDVALATALIPYGEIHHVVTMHGMYEMMEPEQVNALLPLLFSQVDHFVYTAEKNVEKFPPSFVKSKHFSRINNALPSSPVNSVNLEALGIQSSDFVLCMVSRAIPEKGWEEGIGAVCHANKFSRRKIKLLVIGDGLEFDRLRNHSASDSIIFLGFKRNVRDYFSACHMGFLPSRFQGESAPLVLIDCLLAGRPFLSSNIGEIRYMLDGGDGLAGDLFELQNWEIDVESLGRKIAELANDPSRYQILLGQVAKAAQKFSMEAMVDQYDTVYRSMVDWA